MEYENNNSNRQTLSSMLYQFAVGALLGVAFICIPLAISVPGMAVWNIAASVTIVLLCSVLSALFGRKILSALMSVLESFPPIA